ncbi:MAG: hypothetical protein E7644_08835 [Ruminococcaceae bacterium]|nr:hypothetical protein [Oscillospiraceae bacterium]
MKFLLFSDFHHAPGHFMSGGDADMTVLLDHAKAAEVDFIIHTGDFASCSYEPQITELIERYNNFDIPTYHCLGNHDADKLTKDETVALYGMPHDHYFFDCKGYRFVVLNPNYLLHEGEYIPYGKGNYFKAPKERDWLPPEQIAFLKEAIDSAPHPVVILSHESFERPNGVKNREEVLEIINTANKKRPHSVLMCINGHHHRDHLRVMDGVLFFDMNSTRFDWLKVTHDLYPADLAAQYKHLNRCVHWNDPLHCIVTLEGNTVEIEGMESSYFMGVTTEMTDSPKYDKAGRPATPKVQSARITLG